jgi:hypothetical protein
MRFIISSPKRKCYLRKVKKVLAIFLLLQFVSNNSFAEELLKLPRLFTHFYHHSKIHNENDGFFEYLHKHYTDHHKDKHSRDHSDEDNDCNLPFKHCGNCCVSMHVSTNAFLPSVLAADFNMVDKQSNTFPVGTEQIPNVKLDSIWQPPRLI